MLTLYFASFILSHYAYGTLTRSWPSKVRHHIWDLLVNLGLICNIARIVYNNPSVMDLTDPKHIVQGNITRYPELEHHLTIETAWYASGIYNMCFFKDAGYTHSLIAHHMTSILLLFIAEYFNLTVYGFSLIALLTLSNPFMHVAKALHALNNKRGAALTFTLFAAVFFLTRIVMFPLWYLRSTVVLAFPYYKDRYIHIYLLCNGLLSALFLLQLFWFNKIVHMLMNAVAYHEKK